ncbi:MAG: galactokinase family protein, partial [Candidatus Latescibacteria bacterium]|nr:galactokinase family protein [Candidatus Latescibacterota bacterium]
MIIGQQPISKWQDDLNTRSTHLTNHLKAIYGNDLDILESRLPLYKQALQTFANAYGMDRDAIISRAPGRINLLGNHIDHRGGHCNYIAINRETLLV